MPRWGVRLVSVFLYNISCHKFIIKYTLLYDKFMVKCKCRYGGIMMINLTDIGKRISNLRKGAGLSQSSLSKYLSMDQSNLSKIESGTRSMNSEDIEKLASLFCCPVDYIVYGGDRPWECNLSFRANNLDNEDMEALAVINNLAKNQFEMDILLGDDNDQ